MRGQNSPNNGLHVAKYNFIKQIGSGSFGHVSLAINTVTNEHVAIKIIELEDSDDEIEEIQSEVIIMSRLFCPNVVKFYASYIVGTELWIVMEYCQWGACSDLLHKGGLEEYYVLIIAREVLKGLEYLHSWGHLHRDIKAANILISEDGAVKLADFGVSGQITTMATRRNTFVGTPFWMAPEVIKRCGYDASADIWSFGITLIELLEGRPPHTNMHPMKALFAISKGPAPKLGPSFSKSLRDLVASCLCLVPSERATAKDLMKLKIIKSSKRTSFLLCYVKMQHEEREKSNVSLKNDKSVQRVNPKRKDLSVHWSFETIKAGSSQESAQDPFNKPTLKSPNKKEPSLSPNIGILQHAKNSSLPPSEPCTTGVSADMATITAKNVVERVSSRLPLKIITKEQPSDHLSKAKFVQKEKQPSSSVPIFGILDNEKTQPNNIFISSKGSHPYDIPTPKSSMISSSQNLCCALVDKIKLTAKETSDRNVESTMNNLLDAINRCEKTSRGITNWLLNTVFNEIITKKGLEE